jgi:hypothetical protein
LAHNRRLQGHNWDCIACAWKREAGLNALDRLPPVASQRRYLSERVQNRFNVLYVIGLNAVHKVWIVNSTYSRSVFRYFGDYDLIRFNIYLIAGMVAVLDVPLIGLKTDLVYCIPAQLAQGNVELAFINTNVVLVAGSTNFQNEVPVRKVWGAGRWGWRWRCES